MTRLATAQAELFAVDDVLPPGLAQATYHQYTARRRVHVIEPADMPPPIARLRDRLAAWTGVAPGDFVHALVSEYRPGTPLGWHRDAPQYEQICGVSLGGPATLRLRPWPAESTKAVDVVSLDLAPRSAYGMRGPARWGWQHGVPAVKSQRWSVTMRTGRSAATSASGTPAPRAPAARGT